MDKELSSTYAIYVSTTIALSFASMSNETQANHAYLKHKTTNCSHNYLKKCPLEIVGTSNTIVFCIIVVRYNQLRT